MPPIRTLTQGAGKIGGAGAAMIAAAQFPILLCLAGGLVLLVLLGLFGLALPSVWGNTRERRNASFRVIRVITGTIRPTADLAVRRRVR